MVHCRGVVGHQGIFPEPRQPQAAHGNAAAAEGSVREFVVDHAAVENQQVAGLDLIGGLSNQKAGTALLHQKDLREIWVGVEQPGVVLV